MNKLMIALFFAVAVAALAFTSSVSAEAGKAMTPQQEKFAACSHKSKGLKGDEHKKFMSECLKGKGMPMENKDKMMMRQERMKTCNAEADHKKLMGNERKDFVNECLNHGHK